MDFLRLNRPWETICDQVPPLPDDFFSDCPTTPIESLPPLPGDFVSNESFVESLPTKVFPRPRDCPKPPPCSLCSEDFDVFWPRPPKELPCGHCFHEDCILESLKRRNICPVCCSEMPEPMMTSIIPKRVRRLKWVKTGPDEWSWMVDDKDGPQLRWRLIVEAGRR